MAQLACAVALMVNLTTEPWTDEDKKNMTAASKRCVELYPDAPCLVKFVKVRTLTYRAICGEQ